MNNPPQAGTLYGIGVGPGDPELVTLKAVNILQRLDYIFGAAAAQNEHSIALRIAGAYLREGCVVDTLPFAMTRDEAVTAGLWRDNAARLAHLLTQGKNVGFVTLGDPLIYSTYGYLLREMRRGHPAIPVVTIPGITSFQAAAARLGEPLVEGDESLCVTSARSLVASASLAQAPAENLVIMKAGKDLAAAIAWLDQRDLLSRCHALRRCSLPDESVAADPRNLLTQSPDYWTLLLCHARR